MAKDVITGALKLTPPEREAFVRERCSDDTLRQEIDALLKQYEEAPEFLESLARFEKPDEFADLQPGSRVGPYVILERLGRGGMGQVFLGSDPRLHRRVALKCLISTRLTSEDRRRRILEEARAAARISHPNVATVHDVIEQDSRAFIVMEYVEGESLAARMKRERLPIDRVVSIGRQLAGAVAAAHSTGIVHRDLKPANVQLTLDGSVKVLDFGVARALAAPIPASDSTTTAAGQIVRGPQVGTPGYMSPEQMLGRDVDDRSDVFGLGVILYEMTTGRRPYASDSSVDLLHMLARHPARADVDDARVPSTLADVIEKALEIAVADRFQSAAAVVVALESIEQELSNREAVPRIAKSRWIARALPIVPMIPAVLVILGFLTTAAFNNTFLRNGAFAWESPAVYLNWGYRAVVGMLFWFIATIVTAFVVKFATRVVLVFPKINRALKRFSDWSRQVMSRVGLNDPVVLAQAIATCGAIAIVAVSWRYYSLVRAWYSFASTAPPEQLQPLQPSYPYAHERAMYRIVLDIITLALGVGLFNVLRLRTRQSVQRGVGAVSVLAVVIGLTVLMCVLPYRVFYAEVERIDFADTRCYAIGKHENDLLLYCPDIDPPRNRVVAADDRSLHRRGIVESVFTPPEQSGRTLGARSK
jgi:serine/threonine protein kinase